MEGLLRMESFIKDNEKLISLLENLFEDGSSAVVMIEDITRHFPYPTFIIHTWSSFNDTIKFVESCSFASERIEINDDYFYGCLYASIMMEDERLPEDSPVIISLITCLRVGMLRGTEDFMKNKCSKVLLVGLKRIHTRDLVGWNVSSEFMFLCLQAIKTMNMDTTLINSFINMLMIYTGKHFDMVNNLSLADEKSPCGLLAFACLANLFVKNCEDKQTIMETMLENMEHVMEDNSGLNSFQVSVKQSNFRVMIRQVQSALTSCSDHILFAILRMAERHPTSKSLLFIINQLPFSLFCQFVKVVVRLCSRSYYQQMQMFSFNMLESPYITEEEEEAAHLEHLYRQISESLIKPLQSFEQQPAVETIKLVYAMLQIQNAMVQSIVAKMTRESPIMKELMTYINQYCSSTWKQEHKVMNQYYISIYCRLLIINKETAQNAQFTQFASLLLHASPQDILPCLKDLRALVSSETFQLKVVQVVIVNSLAHVTQNMTTHSIQFLRLLHDIIFADLRCGHEYYNLIALKTPQSDFVLKNFVKSRLITQKDVENLSVLCKHLHGWRLMSDLSIHMDVPLSKHILHFTEHLHEVREKILADMRITFVTRFFSEVLDKRGRTCLTSEKNVLLRFSVFLEGCLIKRAIPLSALPLALITVRKYHTFLNTPLMRLQSMNSEIEEKTCTAFEEMVNTRGNVDSIAVLTRDVGYFAETQMVFGDLQLFKPRERTRTVIDKGIAYFELGKSNRMEFTPLTLEMIKCMTKVAIRRDDLVSSCVNSLGQLLKQDQRKVKEICLDCLYDIALFRTASYEMLIPHVYDLLTSIHPLDAVTALNMYAKLFTNEHTFPNDWQTFVIALAVGNDDVVKLIEPEVLDTFMAKLNPYFENYFIHIMLYCNEICDNENHVLLPEFKEKIIKEKLSAEMRHRLYAKMIRYFRPESRSKILNYIYKKLVHEYLRPGDLEGMRYDVLIVTYEVLKFSDYPELSHAHYEKTLMQIKRLETYTSKKLGNGINADEIVTLIISKLTKILYNLNYKHCQLMLKLFHVIFAVIDWHYESIFNVIVDEGMNGKLRKSILRLLDMHKTNGHLFHYIDLMQGIEIQANPIKSHCNRV